MQESKDNRPRDFWHRSVQATATDLAAGHSAVIFCNINRKQNT